MSCENETMQALKESGHRLTPQRLLILSALRHTTGHMTATQIYDSVRVSYPYIDVSTVYRTLGVLKNMRLVSETNISGGEAYYEWLEHERHHHLICRNCEKLTLLDHDMLESLSARIMSDHGFQAEMDHFAIFGLCKECRGKKLQD